MNKLVIFISLLTIIFISFSINNAYSQENNSSQQSPLKQFKSGIPAKNVQCNIGFELIFKTEDGSPACVKPDHVTKLVFLGWASMTPSSVTGTNFKIVGSYDGLYNKTGIINIQNRIFYMTTYNSTLNPTIGYADVTFHGVNFTLFPQPQSLEISGSEFYAYVKFLDGTHEQLWLEPTIYSDMKNLTITRLTQHMQPQAGIVSYNEQIKLLVSTDNKTIDHS